MKIPEPETARKVPGVDEPIPMLPFPSITNLSLVPMTDDEAILNLPPSRLSTPIVQLDMKLPAFASVVEAVKVS